MNLLQYRSKNNFNLNHNQNFLPQQMLKTIIFFHIIIYLILTVLLQSIQIPASSSQLKSQLDLIDNQIISYQRMSFLNWNFNNITIHSSQIFNEGNIFDRVKIRKFGESKIDVGQDVNGIQERIVVEQGNQRLGMKEVDAKQRYLESIKLVSTIALPPSKRFQGVHTNSHIIFHAGNKFYSLDGDPLLSIPLYNRIIQQAITNPDNQLNSLKYQTLMITCSRNENFYIAKYVEQHSVRYNADCLNVEIMRVEMRNRRFEVDKEKAVGGLKVVTNVCRGQGIREGSDYYVPYEYFFVYSESRNRPLYYILATRKQINFFIYNKITEQLLMDQNKTITLAQINGDLTEQLSSIIKLNTYLIILTNRNHLLSINLQHHYHSQQSLTYHHYHSLTTYQTVCIKFQELHLIQFNDNDFRFFYLLSDKNIYLYKLSTQKIVKKYPLQSVICSKINYLQEKCTENIWILENYILVQQKLVSDDQYSVDYWYFLIDKSSDQWYQFKIPFSHQNKCSRLKRIFITKNKNAHYIITLACFIQQEQTTYTYTVHDTLTQRSHYLILQHLNLQTSNEMNSSSSDINGVDFSKFRVPMIVFSIGLVCYITLKRSNKKSPEKIIEQQKLQKKYEQEILSTIRREKQRQQAINLHKKQG